MEYTLVDAAKAAKVNRSTLFRAIKAGRLSARREEDGSYKVDASELARVYDLQHVTHKVEDALHSAAQGMNAPATSAQGESSGAELAFLRARMLEDQLPRFRVMVTLAQDVSLKSTGPSMVASSRLPLSATMAEPASKVCSPPSSSSTVRRVTVTR